MIMVGAFNKQKLSGFTGGSTRFDWLVLSINKNYLASQVDQLDLTKLKTED